MTAEVVVMNTKGVALAADSAVTIQGKKVYNSANKLFPLSEHHPVGVMVFGSAQFMNIPWETIVKLYGRQLGNQEFDELEDYADRFIDFLHDNDYPELMSLQDRELFTKDFLYAKIDSIHQRCQHLHREIYFEYQDEKSIEAIQDIYTYRVEEWLRGLVMQYQEKDFIPPFNESDFQDVAEKYTDPIIEYMKEHFTGYLLTENLVSYVLMITFNSLFKRFDEQYSGVVFAGFGKKELRPAAVTLHIERMINGKLKYQKKPNEQGQIEVDNLGTIIGLAQKDMVMNFMTGIHEIMEESILTHLENNLEQLPGILLEQLQDHFQPDTNLEKVGEMIRNELLRLYGDFHQKIYHSKLEYFIQPTMDIVGALPINELAEMAEMLVNMTSFKRKISDSLETVSDPIDVAVITKHEGFIWVKNKQGV